MAALGGHLLGSGFQCFLEACLIGACFLEQICKALFSNHSLSAYDSLVGLHPTCPSSLHESIRQFPSNKSSSRKPCPVVSCPLYPGFPEPPTDVPYGCNPKPFFYVRQRVTLTSQKLSISVSRRIVITMHSLFIMKYTPRQY